MLKELLGRFGTFELAGEGSRQPHVQLNAWDQLPMRFSN
jgi:hypothetical protein